MVDLRPGDIAGISVFVATVIGSDGGARGVTVRHADLLSGEPSVPADHSEPGGGGTPR